MVGGKCHSRGKIKIVSFFGRTYTKDCILCCCLTKQDIFQLSTLFCVDFYPPLVFLTLNEQQTKKNNKWPQSQTTHRKTKNSSSYRVCVTLHDKCCITSNISTESLISGLRIKFLSRVARIAK